MHNYFPEITAHSDQSHLCIIVEYSRAFLMER
jgi:hypothetical protein